MAPPDSVGRLFVWRLFVLLRPDEVEQAVPASGLEIEIRVKAPRGRRPGRAATRRTAIEDRGLGERETAGRGSREQMGFLEQIPVTSGSTCSRSKLPAP